MSLKLGQIAPDFEAITTQGPIRLYDYLGDHWGVLFSHPADFTPVCTTELGAVGNRRKDFEDRRTKVLALSVDSLEQHRSWIEDIEETQGSSVFFPIIADEDKQIALRYEMIHPEQDETHTVRTVYVIGPDRRIKLTITYPPSTGRNFDEILRVLDSLQLTAERKVATPADWKIGQPVIISPAVPDEEADKLFPNGYEKIKPYLRLTEVS